MTTWTIPTDQSTNWTQAAAEGNETPVYFDDNNYTFDDDIVFDAGFVEGSDADWDLVADSATIWTPV